MSDVTARKMMRVAEVFGDKVKTVLDLPSAVLYALAAPSTDDAVVEVVTQRLLPQQPHPTAATILGDELDARSARA
ncbi:hypothetical protein ACVDG5_025770 [Mesorhizobium sp. ORM6]